MTTVGDVLAALDTLTGGRMLTDATELFRGTNPYVVTKSSNIPGKAVVELPGLVHGDPQREIRKLGVAMTVTESTIELAGATGIDCIVAHHPVADAASSGGAPLAPYLDLYGIAVFEAHEAFHALHPGMAFLHGHRPFRAEVDYGKPGTVMLVGRVLPGISCAGEVLDRLRRLMLRDEDRRLLDFERDLRGVPAIEEGAEAAAADLVFGRPDAPVSTVLHIFPHTRFTPGDLGQALGEHPDVDLIIASMSRPGPGHPLRDAIADTALPFLVGNTHGLEILENGLPLAFGLQALLPDADIRLLRERVTATPLGDFGTPELRSYGQRMAADHLLNGISPG